MNRFGNGFRFQIRENMAQGTFDVLAGRVLASGDFEVVTDVTITRLPAGSAHPGNMVQLNAGEAQDLIDELWRAGLRPTDARDFGTTGHLEALKRHGEAMEAIAFGLLRRDGVEL